MKILGVGFNYRPHVAEAPQLGLPEQAVDTPPLFFHKGDALLKPRTPFFLPDMGSSIEYEAELVIQIRLSASPIATMIV